MTGTVSHKFKWLIGAVSAVIILVVAVMAGSGGLLSPFAKREIIRALRQRYRSAVDIQSLDISLFPYPHATGKGLVFRQSGQKDAPAMITLRGFTADTGWLDLLAIPRRVRYVRLDGLQIQISAAEKKPGRSSRQPSGFLIENMDADGTLLRVFPKRPEKPPLVFNIYKLRMHAVSGHTGMNYDADLRNAKPPGLIQATGTFGPWEADDPAETPVTGNYRFSDADLGVFKGISGHLSSTGQFRGALAKIEVNGETDTPDFSVDIAAHPVDLKASFSATVDGENGNTLLHSVTARFGQTTVICQGSVIGHPGGDGKTVSLNAVMQNGELADVLKLVIKSDQAPMTGIIGFRAQIQIPPGDIDIAQKLHLNGQFDLQSSKLTNPALEQKVSKLSARARGETGNNGNDATASNMQGTFILDRGLMTLHGLSFKIPGAAVHLDGTYALLTEAMDFHGTLTMDAKLSQMTTGVKSLLLKALDPLFETRKAGAVIPFHLTGVRAHPKVGLDLRR